MNFRYDHQTVFKNQSEGDYGKGTDNSHNMILKIYSSMYSIKLFSWKTTSHKDHLEVCLELIEHLTNFIYPLSMSCYVKSSSPK